MLRPLFSVAKERRVKVPPLGLSQKITYQKMSPTLVKIFVSHSVWVSFIVRCVNILIDSIGTSVQNPKEKGASSTKWNLSTSYEDNIDQVFQQFF